MVVPLQAISDIEHKNLKNILLIRLSALGDAIQTLPLAKQIQLNFPQCQLHWIIEERVLPLLQEQKNIKFIIFPKKEIFHPNPLRSMAANRQLKEKLIACKFDVAIDSQGLFKSAWISHLSAAPLRLGLNKLNSREGNFLFQTHTLPFIPNGTMHRIELFMQFIPLLGGKIKPLDNLHDIQFTSAEHHVIPELLERLQIKKPFFILNIGTSHHLKRWHSKYWSEFILLIKKTYPEITLVLSGGGSSDHQQLQEIIGFIGNEHFTSAVNNTTLRELMLLTKECQAIVSVDSLALHLGNAFQKKCLAIFGARSLAIDFGPYQGGNYPEGYTLVSNESCHPCRRKKCAHHSCMWNITPIQALEQLQKLTN